MYSFTLTLASISTGHEIGLAAIAAAFIVFTLVSAFVLPRFNPNFPGRGLPAYVVIVVLFFVAMMAAVLILGKEKSEASTETPPAATSTATGTTTTGGATAGGATAGDPAAGKGVFASAGCSGCHTLKAAGATGKVGPDLDQLKPAEATVAHQVENGGGVMPAFKGTLSAKQIQDVAAFVYTSTH